MKVMKFSYLDEFSCIGPDCTDSCCRNWQIMLTKSEYLKYKGLKCSDELNSIINTAFRRNRRNGSDYHYALMSLREDGSCPFLGGDSLCMLQKELGEDVLTIVCSTFPRLNLKVGEDFIVRTASATCPHVAEILIDHPEGLRISEEEYDGKNRFINKNLFSGGGIPASWEGFPSYWLYKSAQLGILQNRKYPLNERLLILGYFSQKAEECISDAGKMQTLSAAMLDDQLCGKIVESLTVNADDLQTMKKSVDIIGEIVKLSEMSDRLDAHTKELLTEMMSGINFRMEHKFIDEKVMIECSFDVAVMLGYREATRRLENERPHIFENILVNHAFGEVSDRGIWLNYFVLAVYYNMLRLFVPVFLTPGFTDAQLAQAVTNVTKIIINTGIAENHVYNLFREKGYSALPHIVFLLTK